MISDKSVLLKFVFSHLSLNYDALGQFISVVSSTSLSPPPGAGLGHLAAIEWLNSSVVAADAERVRSVGSELRALLRAFYDALELRR